MTDDVQTQDFHLTCYLRLNKHETVQDEINLPISKYESRIIIIREKYIKN